MFRTSARPTFSALLVCALGSGGFGAPASGELEAGPQFQVSDADASSEYVVEDRPSVAWDAAGNFVVVWVDHETGTRIRGQRFASDGTTRGDVFQVGDATGEHVYRQFQPSVAADADGDFVVVWTGWRGHDGESVIYGRRFAADGTPSDNEFSVNNNMPVPADLTKASALTAGK